MNNLRFCMDIKKRGKLIRHQLAARFRGYVLELAGSSGMFDYFMVDVLSAAHPFLGSYV